MIGAAQRSKMNGQNYQLDPGSVHFWFHINFAPEGIYSTYHGWVTKDKVYLSFQEKTQPDNPLGLLTEHDPLISGMGIIVIK